MSVLRLASVLKQSVCPTAGVCPEVECLSCCPGLGVRPSGLGVCPGLGVRPGRSVCPGLGVRPSGLSSPRWSQGVLQSDWRDLNEAMETETEMELEVEVEVDLGLEVEL